MPLNELVQCNLCTLCSNAMPTAVEDIFPYKHCLRKNLRTLISPLMYFSVLNYTWGEGGGGLFKWTPGQIMKDFSK